MIDAILGVLGLGRLYLTVSLDGVPVETLTELCLVREGSAAFEQDERSIVESIRHAPLGDASTLGAKSMLDTQGRWNGALLRAGVFRGFVRFNKVGSISGRWVAADYCFEIAGPITVVAGQDPSHGEHTAIPMDS